MKRTFLVLLMLLALPLTFSFVDTVPPPPNTPQDAPEGPLLVEMPRNINADRFTATLWNVGPSRLTNCSMSISGAPPKIISSSLTAGSKKDVAVYPHPGRGKFLYTTCDDGGANVSVVVSFSVNYDNTSTLDVDWSAPQEGTIVAEEAVTASFENKGPTAASCTLTLGDISGDSYQVDFIVAAGETVSEEGILAQGENDLLLDCTNTEVWSDSQTWSRTVSYYPGSKPPKDYVVFLHEPQSITGADFTISFEHNYTGTANCKVYLDGTLKRSIGTPSSVKLTYDYTEPDGPHLASVNCTQGSWTHSVAKAFTIDNSTGIPDPTNITNTTGTNNQSNTTNESSLNSTILIRGTSGTLPTVIAGDPFVIDGSDFPAGDNVSIRITGLGTTQRESILVDSAGYFSFTHSGLNVTGTYSITVLYVEQREYVRLLFAVVKAPDLPTDAEQTEYDEWEPQDTTDTTNTQTDSVSDSGSPNTRLYGGQSNNDQQPTHIDPYHEAPQKLSSSERNWFMWVLVGFLVIVLVVGGTAGYLVYGGQLDVSSVDGFMNSLNNLFAGGNSSGSAKHVAGPTAEKITGFIEQERLKGFDDLTIRSSLLSKGWEKEDVDDVFDTVYSMQKK